MEIIVETFDSDNYRIIMDALRNGNKLQLFGHKWSVIKLDAIAPFHCKVVLKSHNELLMAEFAEE